MERFPLNDGANSTLFSLAKKPAFRLKGSALECFFQEKNVWFGGVTSYLLNGKTCRDRNISPQAQKNIKVSVV